MKQWYMFYNQYNTFLYQGEHESAEEAWKAFFDWCDYPPHARNIEEVQASGIYFKTL